MNLLQKILLGKSTSRLIDELKAIQSTQQSGGVQLNKRYTFKNGRIVTPADNKQSYIDYGYNVNDIIYSVTNLILDKVVLPEFGLYKVVNEQKRKEYHAIMSRKDITGIEYKRAMKLKSESVEPLTSFNLQEGKFAELLKYPNEVDTFQDHNRILFLHKLLVGDYFEWWRILKAGANEGMPNSLEWLPAQFVNIKVADGFPVRPSSYELTIWNQEFAKEEILHEKYVNPNADINGQQLYGFAPLRAFYRNTERNNAAKDSSTAKFRNGGVEEIAYIDHPDFNAFSIDERKSQIALLKEKWNKEHTGTSNQGKVMFSGAPMGSVHLGNSPVELGIIDSEKWDAIMFCNGYGVPPELLGLTQKTYNNVKEAEKALTTRSAIPLLTSRRNSLTRFVNTNTSLKGRSLCVDYNTECFPELQTNAKEAMEALSMLTMVTPNEERQAINMEDLTHNLAYKPWVKTGSGRQPIEDYEANAVDQALMREQALNANEDDDKVKPIRAANSGDGKKRISNA